MLEVHDDCQTWHCMRETGERKFMENGLNMHGAATTSISLWKRIRVTLLLKRPRKLAAYAIVVMSRESVKCEHPNSNFHVLSNRLRVTIDQSLREKGSRMEIDESRCPRSMP